MQRNNEQIDEIEDDLRRALIPRPPSPTATQRERNNDDAFSVANEQRWYQNSSQIIAMISNFSTSYNVVNISLVLPILKAQYSGCNDEDSALVASSLIAGMIGGQLVGGALGDSCLGRIGALRLVMLLQVVASLASAFGGIASGSSTESIFMWLSAWRFVLGIGCGGVYPLAAVISVEEDRGKVDRRQVEFEASNSPNRNISLQDNQGKNSSNLSSVQRVVLTFSMQGIGFVSVPLVSVFLLYCSSNLNFIWRTILGIGALPGAVLMCMQCEHISRCFRTPPTDDTPQDAEQSEDIALGSVDVVEEEPSATQNSFDIDQNLDEMIGSDNGGWQWFKSLFHEPQLGRKVLGTAGTWFLFDILFYGNTIFQPIVIEEAFGNNDGKNDGVHSLRKTAMISLILTSIALPGYAMAGIMIGQKAFCLRQTPRYIMLQGFGAMAILYAIIGLNWSYLRDDPTILVILYGMTFFFANYGPNTTTFILPSLIFEENHRATWNGVAAASGKIGALTGAALFEPTVDAFGDYVAMLICAAVALLACLLTFHVMPKEEKVEEHPEALVHGTATHALSSTGEAA